MINKILKNDDFKIFLILAILTFSIFFIHNIYNPYLNEKLDDEDSIPWIMEGITRATLGKFFDIQYFSHRNVNINFSPFQLMFWYYTWVNFGEEPYLWHFLCNFIHLINTVIVFFLANKFIKNKFFSFLAALSFAVFLLNFNTLKWVASGITWGLTAFFMLTTFLLIIEYFKTKKRIFYFLSLLLFFTGTFVKETTVFSVPILFMYYLILQRKKELKFIKTDLFIIPYILLSLPIILITVIRPRMIPLAAAGSGFDLSIGAFYRLIDYINFLITIIPVSFNIELLTTAFSLSLFFVLIYFGLKNENLLFLTIWLLLLTSIPIFLNFNYVYNSSRYLYLPSIVWFILLYYIVSNIRKMKVKIITSFFLVNYTIVLNLFLILMKK